MSDRRVYRKGAVGKPRTKTFLLVTAIAGLFVAIVSAYVGYNASYTVPGRSYYNLHADFDHAENLANHYEVRIGGLRAGKMLNPHVHNGKARIDLRLSSEFKPLLSDSKLRVRLRSAIGVRYVEILPGRKGTPLPEGAVIPASQTARPVALDSVLSTFDPKTRVRTAQFLRELGGGAANKGDDVNAALDLGPEFLSGLGTVSDALVSQTGSVRSLIRSLDGAAQTFDPVRNTIAEGFDPEARAMRPFADSANSLHSTLEEAPPTLTQLRTGLPAVTRLVGQVDGLAREGRPALAAAPGALRETSRLLINSRPALDSADRTLDLARRAVDPTLGVLNKIRPVLPGLDTAMSSLLPSVKSVGDQACDITTAMTGWSYSMVWGDDYGGGIRFFVSSHADQLAGQTGAGRVPDGQGGDAYARFVKLSAYPGKCVNNVSSEAGAERPTLEAYLKSLGYTGVKP